jgi:hypothetical protein
VLAVQELAAYGIAGVVYVGIGIFVPAFLFSWVGAAAYLLVALWLVPAAVRRSVG